MQLTLCQEREIEQIISGIDCPKDFACHRSGFKNLSRVKVIADGKLIECLQEDARMCQFALTFGNAIFCKCPLRFYIAKNLGR